jgi:hypothetical protein
MPRFFSGDELGNIKALTYLSAESKVTVETLYDGSGKGKHRAVQKMAVSTDGQLVRVQTILHDPFSALLILKKSLWSHVPTGLLLSFS